MDYKMGDKVIYQTREGKTGEGIINRIGKAGWITLTNGRKIRQNTIVAKKVRNEVHKVEGGAKSTPTESGNKRSEGLIKADLSRYKAVKRGKTRSFDNDDLVARTLREMDLDAVYKLAAEETGALESDLRARYEHLNRGMQRMNLGNRIRAAMNRK